MSGICGNFNLDTSSVTDSELRAMTAMLERRGPEGTNWWLESEIGLGHTLLATTPELEFERQPFTHQDTGCVITADVRLDNRDELLGAFGLRERRDVIGDAELILLAYLNWDEQCLDRLLGDFAFAIWDPRHRKLFCARDHFGMRPLYYHHKPGKHFLFASDARAILVLPQVPYQVNKGRVADFLVPQLEWIDYTSTFYEDVYRLPPGNKVSVTLTGINVAEYWKPEPVPEPGPMSDEEYKEGFLEVFTEAVEARLRAPSGTVGSMLSGGMDSGSVVAVAKDILSVRGDEPLPTYSATRSDDVDCAESRAIRAALTLPAISPTLIHADELTDDFESLTSASEEPFDAEFTILKAIFLAANKQGRKVVFDGAGGDIVLGEGSYIVRLIRQGRLRLAMTEIAATNRFWGGTSVSFSMLRYLRAAIVPEAVKARLRGLVARRQAGEWLGKSLISRDFASSVNIENRFARMRQMFPGTWTADYAVERCNSIRPNLTAGRERYARMAAASATEARDPFLDKRVVDFCAHLPGRFRLQDGWPKMILRDLMDGRLPDEVRWSRGKPHLGWFFNAAVTELAIKRGKIDDATLQRDLQDYVDPAALARAWQSFRGEEDAERLHSAYSLSVWLRENANRPVVPIQLIG